MAPQLKHFPFDMACAARLHFSASAVSKLRHGAILPPMHHKQYRLFVHLSRRRWPVCAAFMLYGLQSHLTAVHLGEKVTAEVLPHACGAMFSYYCMSDRMALRRPSWFLLMHPS